jgi:U3 small nucleolar RNA-associated protein 5
VHDVAFGAGASTVYASSDDCQVTAWSINTGKESWSFGCGKQPARRIAVHPSEDALATGGTAIKVWDLATRISSRKYAGHASAITSMEYSPDSRYLLSAAGDRFISLWDASEGGANKAALMVFTLDSQPVCLAFPPSSAMLDEDMLSFLAVSQAGSVGVWRVGAPDAGGSKRADVKPVAAGCKVVCEGKGDGVVSAAWEAGGSVRVVRGPEALPIMEAVSVDDGDGVLVASVKLSKREGGALLGSSKKEKKGKGGGDAMEDIMGPADMPINQAGAEVGGKKRRVEEEAELSEDDEIGSLDGEETLEDKVRALGLDGGAGRSGGGQAPKAESVHTILIQALQSDDKQLLEQCLGVTNQRVITSTVAKLPPSAVSALLTKVVVKFQARPTRSVNLVTWIRAIVTQHSSYLMSQPDVVKTITPLYQLVESRVAVYHKLLKLEGRLELALSQVSGGEYGGEVRWKEPDLTVHDEVDGVDEVVGADGEDSSDEEGESEEDEEEEEEDDAMDEDDEDDDDEDDD